MAQRSDEITFEKYAGLNNVQGPKDLEPGELQSIANININDRGKPERRPGRRKIYAGTPENLYQLSATEALFTDSGSMKRVVRDVAGNYSFPTVRTGLMPGRRMAYAEVNGTVYYSDGRINGVVRDGVDRPWGVPAPYAWPTLSATGGALPPGMYQVAFTYVDDEGVEGGTHNATEIELASTGGIQISGIPVSNEPHVARVRIYASPVNGDALYYSHSVANGVTSTTVTQFQEAIPLETQFLDRPPAADLLAYQDGRIFCAKGVWVYKTRPLQYHLFKPDEDYHGFPASVTLLAAVGEGLYVGSDRIYWMTVGEAGTASIAEVAPDVAVPGTLCRVDGSELPEAPPQEHILFYGRRGLYLAGPGGQIRNLTDGRVDFGAPASGAQAVVKSRRNRYAVATHSPGFRASDNAEIEIRRNGVVV